MERRAKWVERRTEVCGTADRSGWNGGPKWVERRTEVGGTTDQKGGTADQQDGTADWPVLIRSPFGLFAAPSESPFGPLCPFLMALWFRVFFRVVYSHYGIVTHDKPQWHLTPETRLLLVVSIISI